MSLLSANKITETTRITKLMQSHCQNIGTMPVSNHKHQKRLQRMFLLAAVLQHCCNSETAHKISYNNMANKGSLLSALVVVYVNLVVVNLAPNWQSSIRA